MLAQTRTPGGPMFFSSQMFLQLHVAISLLAIAAGFVVAFGLLSGKRLDRWTLFFLTTTVLTSVTGFLFPATHFTPGHGVGILSLLALILAIFARYTRRLAGGWRTVYVIGAVVSLYFNFFVLIVQSFQKVPWLHELAPTQTELPFGIAQGTALVAFIVIGWLGVTRFHERPAPGTP